MEQTLYVVLSRGTDFIFCTFDREKAETAKEKQTFEEEMSGGRPSVYIKETIIKE